MPHCIYIFGPSGSGTTTLAKALAEHLCIYHLDTDDYYWQPTDIPYTAVQPIETRVQNIQNELVSHQSWIISGCMCSWGEDILRDITHVIYLWLPWEIRRARLEAREITRFGAESFAPNGSRYNLYQDFIDWAEQYDSADVTMRSRARHEKWMDELSNNINLLRLETDLTVKDRLDEVIRSL